MTHLRFTKGHGTENDFVLLFDERGAIDLTPELVRFLCDRRAGLGADGVIRAVRAGHLSAGSGLSADTWFMDYWNADGSTSEMCGNGARVFAAFLEREAGAELGGGLTIGTRGGTRTLTALGGGRYAVGMGEFRIADAPGGFDAEVEAGGLSPARPALSIDVGNPHHVVALASTDELEALDLTSAPRVTPTPPAGSNVEFVVTRGGEVRDGVERGRVRMRVHERGSGETRSCGTGACAAALAVRSWAGEGAPDVWDVEVPGGMVTVRVVGTRTVLEGPAVLVADGEVDVSLASPSVVAQAAPAGAVRA
ncbi:diaminopimelate epimerase [Demequina sp. NBRC 110056]|uniref:diaminopimelate epimerase n=1 Tax=Demequina sp. NBRC 110056 TaxID=1570345 RepID=UPI000A047D83|nr:diaminopimelate epimerase [Demequina sp. NBRC 110056]